MRARVIDGFSTCLCPRDTCEQTLVFRQSVVGVRLGMEPPLIGIRGCGCNGEWIENEEIGKFGQTAFRNLLNVLKWPFKDG